MASLAPVGVNNMGLHVADVERSLAFYRDLVGLTVRRDMGWNDDAAIVAVSGTPGARLRVVALELPGTSAVLALVELGDIERAAVRPAFQDPGAAHLSLRVEDLDAALDQLAAAGFPPLGPVAEHRRGPTTARLAFVADPDGFFLELVAITGED
jgi:catechol 2,3-dioxygenase-like lactoylglutathione lyase family enzyme